MLENKDVQVIKVLKDSESRSDKFLRGLIETADVMKGTLRMSPHQNRVDKKNMDRNLNVRDGEDVKHPLEVFRNTLSLQDTFLLTFINTTIYESDNRFY